MGHAVGALYEVLHAEVEDTGSMSVAHLLRWKLKLLNTPGAVWQIATELHQSGKEQVQVGEAQPVHEALTYLENNGERMNTR